MNEDSVDLYQVLGSTDSIMLQRRKNVNLAVCLGPAIRMIAETTQVT